MPSIAFPAKSADRHALACLALSQASLGSGLGEEILELGIEVWWADQTKGTHLIEGCGRGIMRSETGITERRVQPEITQALLRSAFIRVIRKKVYQSFG